MTRRRIFIAVGLPDETRAKIAGAVKRWQWLPIRWLKPENWHITVIPPFYVGAEELERVKEAAAEAAASLRPFSLSFRSIILAPPGKKARMIWLYGTKNLDINKLKGALEKILSKSAAAGTFKKEDRPISLHVTLARFEEGALAQIESKTHTLEELNVSFDAAAIDIMESRLRPAGAEYTKIISVPFGSNEAGPPYEFLPHTADFRIRARGKTPEELFQHSLLGMAEYMKRGAGTLKIFAMREIDISAADQSVLLIDFLSKVITLADTYQEVYPKIVFDELSETRLRGTLFGASAKEFDEDIKAVTYHGAEIQKTAAGYEVTIIYDI